MSSKRETILAAAKAALSGTAAVDARIYRSRVEAFARKETPALIVEPVNDSASRGAGGQGGRLDWGLTFHVVVVVRADEPDQVADPIMIDVHSKIMADATIQGLVSDLVPGSCDWQFIEADAPLGIVTMQFIATYQTNEAEIT